MNNHLTLSFNGNPVAEIDLDNPSKPQAVQPPDHRWHPGNVLWHAPPENWDAIRQGKLPVDDYYNSAVNACVRSAAERAKSTVYPKGSGRKQNATDAFKSSWPIVFPNGTYLARNTLILPPGIGIEGGKTMEDVTIRSDSTTNVDVKGRPMAVGLVMLSYIRVKDLGVDDLVFKGRSRGATGIRVTPYSGQPIVGYLLAGQHANTRFENIGFLGSSDSAGACFVTQSQYHSHYTFHSLDKTHPPVVVEALPKAGVCLDLWLHEYQFERAELGVVITGGLRCKVQGSVWYCKQAISLVDCYHCYTKNLIGDRWNGQPSLGTTKLALYVAGNGNTCEDHIQYAEDYGALVRGEGNSVRRAYNIRKFGYRHCSGSKESPSARGDYVPEGRDGDSSFGIWRTGARPWGGSLSAYQKLWDQEEIKDEDELTES